MGSNAAHAKKEHLWMGTNYVKGMKTSKQIPAED